jgi:hypothetical protein
MFPTDSEFILLYFVYFSVFIYSFLGLILTKRTIHKVNLTIFIVYFLLMLSVFLVENNFKGGNSLAVLFYGGIFVIIHVVIYVIVELIMSFKKK